MSTQTVMGSAYRSKTQALVATHVNENVVFLLCIVVLVLSMMLFVMGLGVIYVGDEYVVPAWSEASFPAPQPPY